MKRFDEVLCEVGDAQHQTQEDARRAGEWVALVARTQPQAVIRLMLGGYDDDPRSLWEIPEAADYVRHVALAAGVADWRSPIVRQFSEGTIVLLSKCEAMGADPPFTVNIVEGAAP